MVGLRRPGRCLLRRRRPTPGAVPLEADFNRPVEAFGRWSACADRRVSFASAEADAWRASALEGRFQSAWRPSAGGRPAPTEGMVFASAEADAWRGAPLEADFNRRGGLRPMVGLRRPVAWCLLRRRRPTPGAQAPWKADFNRRGGLRPMVGLRRPGGGLLRRRRPTLGAQAPLEGRFQSAWRPSAAFSRSACADRKGVFCVGGGRRLARSADPGEGGQAIQVFVPGFADGFCLL
jgi:hypothetical protein